MAAKKSPNLGPAMQAITPMQRRFVQALYDHPGIDGCAALRLAGYRGNPKSNADQAQRAIKKQSDRWRHDERILEAITEYGRSEYNAKLPLAVSVVGDILKDPHSRDRLRAVHGVLDRVGMNAVTETRVIHQFDRSDLLTKIASLLERNMQALHVAAPLPVITDGSSVTAQIVESEGAQTE